MTDTCNSTLRGLLLPALIGVLAVAAALWAGHATDTAEATITDLEVGLDMKSASGNAGTYNISSLPTFESCLDVKTNVNSGIFYLDVFVLNTTNLVAFNVDITFTAGKMQILESDVKQFFTTSSSVYNLSRNVSASPPAVQPAVSDGTFYAGAVDTGSPHTGSGVLSRIKGQGFNVVGGSVIDFRLNINPSLTKGVTLTDSTGAHPGSGADGLFDGPFINQVGTIAVDQPDPDADGVSNTCDNCDNNANSNQADLDGDGLGDVCDSDDDGDGVADGSDNCPTVYNPSQNASACADADGDGVYDGNDNCPNNSNANQANWDNDSQGDVCDPDDDNDGVPDSTDNCDFAANPGQENWDGDAAGDACEDSDLDLWLDSVDNCKALANPSQTNSDSDNFGDICDNCPVNANNSQADWNSDLVGDACQDYDLDVWKDVNEVFSGTKPNQACASTTAPNDEPQDSQVTDFNDDRRSNLSDIVLYGPHFNKVSPDPNYSARFDLNMDNRDNLSDVVLFGPYMNTLCTP